MKSPKFIHRPARVALVVTAVGAAVMHALSAGGDDAQQLNLPVDSRPIDRASGPAARCAGAGRARSRQENRSPNRLLPV